MTVEYGKRSIEKGVLNPIPFFKDYNQEEITLHAMKSKLTLPEMWIVTCGIQIPNTLLIG